MSTSRRPRPPKKKVESPEPARADASGQPGGKNPKSGVGSLAASEPIGRWEGEGGTAPGDVAAVAASPATGGTPISTPQPPPPAPQRDEPPADERSAKDPKGSRGDCGCGA
jgi:hypothetical protein